MTLDIPKLDLRSITRGSKESICSVELKLNWKTRLDWIVLGQTSISKTGGANSPGKWSLKSYLGSGMTDFEHGSAYAIHLPLIGVQFEYSQYGTSYLYAWIDSDAEDQFCVPPPGYDPSKDSKATCCKMKDCSFGRHMLVAYTPPRNPELYKLVRGKQVSILLGGVSNEL